MDLNILIRTVTACDGWWQLQVGGGIVADSQPTLEEQETWHKAEGILRLLISWWYELSNATWQDHRRHLLRLSIARLAKVRPDLFVGKIGWR